MLDKAIRIAAQTFEGKYDKGGNPYILHCLAVMYGTGSNRADIMCAAVLHDLLEDTHYTPLQLMEEGFSNRVVELIEIVTHKENESYDDYIKRVSLDPDAKIIKRADLKHNSNIHRMKGLRRKDFGRLEKYHRAYAYLKD